MKILYIASIRLPTEKAHGIQIMKTCEAFSKVGENIELAVPRFLLSGGYQDPFDYYDVQKNFRIIRVPSIRLIILGTMGFYLETFIFFVFLILSKEFWLADIVFSRDEMLVSLSSLFGKKTIWETHTGSYNIFSKYALKNSILVVSISNGLKDFYKSKGVNPSKIIVSHDAVDMKDFMISESKEDIRDKLSLPKDKKIVLYAGRLDGWKGVETFFEASLKFNYETLAVVVGGDTNQIKIFSNKYPHILFVGYKDYKFLPMYQKAADVLVIPNTAKDQISKLYTSPLKVFTYMTSGVPIVASDLPSLREVLNENNAMFFSADNPESLCLSINKLLGDQHGADIIAGQAKIDVEKYTWTQRVKNIVANIKK